MFPLLQLGPFALQVPGVFLLVGVWWGLSLIEKDALRQKLPAATVYNLVFYGLIAGLVGARLWYAAYFLSVYLENPLSLLALNPATLAPTEGLLTGLVVAVIFGQRKKLPLWPTLDSLTPGLALFAVSLGLSHLASGDAFGAPTSLPWGIRLWDEVRHPSQVYEMMAAGLILLVVQRVKVRSLFPGFTFLIWVALTAAGRLLLEAFRGDSVIVLGQLRAAQLVSLGVLLFALWGLNARYRLTRPEADAQRAAEAQR